MCGIFAIVSPKNSQFSPRPVGEEIQYRGPDHTDTVTRPLNDNGYIKLVFHRLAIMDTSAEANKMLQDSAVYLICNGEIYNYEYLLQKYSLQTVTSSDCEVILRFYLQFPEKFVEFMSELSGDFAFVLYDEPNKKVMATRDRIGVRPLFYSMSSEYYIFASEGKAIPGGRAKQFPPGQLMVMDLSNPVEYGYYQWYTHSFITTLHFDHTLAKTMIRELLISAVKKRLMSDRPVGFLLSGGLDSSLIAGIAHRCTAQKITTFSIGLPGSTDLIAAEQVARYLGSDHHSIIISTDDIINAIDPVIYHCETYDITTIRASIPMYLLGKYIRENTDIKVVLSGEGSDELFGGYLYFHKAPDYHAFQKESVRLVKDLYLFDVLRADRTISAHGLELRVPFLDADVVSFATAIDPKWKAPVPMEKMILRQAFADMELIPENILFRQKQAFSDGVGYSSVEKLKEIAEEYMLPPNLELPPKNKAQPETKEALMYYSIFKEYYTKKIDLYTPYYWMPKWCEGVTDPSATVLKDLHTP